MATISPQRLEALRAMPYQEYLTTPEWQATRKHILQRDHYQCQGCHAVDVLLHVHHYTYERLGCEQDEDLVTLCEDCHEELHRLMADPPKLSFLQRWSVGLGTAVIGTIGVEGLLRAPLPAEIGVLVGAFLLASKSPTIYGWLKEKVPPEPLAWLGHAPQSRKERKPSLLDIWLARAPKQPDPPDEAEMAAFMAEWEAVQRGDLPGEVGSDEDGEDPFEDVEGEDDLVTVAFRGQKPVRVFSDLLKTGWRPTLEQIYVGTDTRGNHLFVPVAKLWHIALAGSTGHGKSSLLRLLLAQLCYLKLPVVLLNPHYMIYDFDHREDWTPYTPYLKSDPMECKKIANIESMLRWMATDLLERRKERASQGRSAGKPFFFLLDEYPDIKAEIKDAPELVGKLLRQGRKYGIYLIVASQNYDVKTLGVEGEGGVRKCFRTIFYVGGDPVSVKELLNTKVSEIPENDLGQGTIMLKCATIEDPIVASVPYLDNESLSLLLGPSTYAKPSTPEVPTSELEEMGAKRTEHRDKPTMKPNIEDKGPKAEDIDLTILILCWNGGANSVEKLMKAFKMTHHQATVARKRILDCAEKHIDEEKEKDAYGNE
jgi:hypothetical protein